MNTQSSNFSTGPVNISKEVQAALASPAISHRSKEFTRLFNDTKDFLCAEFNTRDLFILTGGGTAANEAMIWQIKMLGGKGLILSNGEFGLRLISQAKRASLNFNEYRLAPGSAFDNSIITGMITEGDIKWVLFCHCETSTGVMNDMEGISSICTDNNCGCFVDCMSTAGTTSIDLSQVTMATASSGKALASIPGLAIIFSNTSVTLSNVIPLNLDLGYYSDMGGVPFTLSSNQLKALNVSVRQKLNHGYYQMLEHYSYKCNEILREGDLLPYCNKNSKVFTINAKRQTQHIIRGLQKNMVLSYESKHLLENNFCQLAFFGYYQTFELERLVSTLNESITQTLENNV